MGTHATGFTSVSGDSGSSVGFQASEWSSVASAASIHNLRVDSEEEDADN